jgi:molecular chaperone DnaK
VRKTIDFGIYLGTHKCSIAVLSGTRAQVIKNNDSMEYTPCVVYIDKNNRLAVGRVAKQRLESEPEDAYSEFRLQMGSNREYRFKNSGKVMRPEELTAEVLKSIKRDVYQRLGEDITAAVITVPAAFDLPQCDATRRAAKLAGLETVPLIMEPTAAALAHAFQTKADKVFWLVYDLGSGTFDAAIIQIQNRTVRIVNHAGDNHLGGNLIDWEIVDKVLAPAAAKVYRLSNFTRGVAKWRTAFAKLKYVAEEARIQLSTTASHLITIDYLCKDDSGEPVPFQYEFTRKEVFSLAQPFIQRSVNISCQVLAEARLGIRDIEKVVLVGGPTLAPYLREMLLDPKEGLGIPLDYSIDPLTVVVQGAAIFAGTQRLEGEGDPDAADKAQNRQLDPKIATDQAEEMIILNDEFHAIQEEIDAAQPICQRLAKSENISLLEKLHIELQRAYQQRSLKEFRKITETILDTIKAIRYEALMFDVHIHAFHFIVAQEFTSSDTQAYQVTLASAQQAILTNNQSALQKAFIELGRLLNPTDRELILSHYSDIDLG